MRAPKKKEERKGKERKEERKERKRKKERKKERKKAHESEQYLSLPPPPSPLNGFRVFRHITGIHQTCIDVLIQGNGGDTPPIF